MYPYIGGVSGKRREKKKKKGGPTLRDVTTKLKEVMPLVESMGLQGRPHLHQLLLNHAVLAAHHAGELVLLVHGQATKEVSESWLLAERAVLVNGELHRPEKVEQALAKMREEKRLAQSKRKVEASSHQRSEASGTSWRRREAATGIQHTRENIAGLLRSLEELTVEDSKTSEG